MDLPALPVTVTMLHVAQIRLVLIDASVSEELFNDLHKGVNRVVFGRLLSFFDLIIPQSGADIARFRMLGAQQKCLPGWCNDLTLAARILAPIWSTVKPSRQLLAGIRKTIQQIPSWLTVQLTQEEYEIMCWVQKMLLKDWKGLTLFVVLESEEASYLFTQTASRLGLGCSTLWDGTLSHFQQLTQNQIPVILCSQSHAPLLYAVVTIVFIGSRSTQGGSEWEGALSEAALYGCAIITGESHQQQSQQQQQQQQQLQSSQQFQQQRGSVLVDQLNQMAVTAANEIVYAMYTCGTHVELFQEEMMEGDGEAEQSEGAGDVGNNAPVSLNNETECFTTGSSFQWESPDVEYTALGVNDSQQFCSLRAMTAAQYGRLGGLTTTGGEETILENHQEGEERPQTAPASLIEGGRFLQARVGRLERVISGDIFRTDSRASGYSTDGLFLARAGSNAMELRPSPVPQSYLYELDDRAGSFGI
eukprot:TRINITY_DN41235_c0_g1_i1.p1 TRINITY_DN41235_c0_g1~~TRINITY_DN41235_c0_g1_i1.p1  ORF type:complete len:475 (+),score=76.57 TRINITY_DN41235_c0_g1_i1:1-1425(+)